MSESVATRIAAFLTGVGIRVRAGSLDGPTQLPGIAIEAGELVIDESRLLYPGDLLHEAGHLAVVPEPERSQLGGDVGQDGGSEMAAVAWSYAACVHLGLEPSVVFHPDGYKGGSDELIEAFTERGGIGVPLLVWWGMTTAYPQMVKWTR